ncbi:hypothetical protein HY090_02810 [Candidatus Kaiserbacteria bacterium]|nr:hypothetical protein [Candidatus Kaiserbacteria bacterium]
METRNSWGIVYVAVIFSAVAIGISLFVSYMHERAKAAEVVAIGKNIADWHGITNTVDASATATPPLSQGIATDFVAGYQGLLNKGEFTSAERDQLFADIVRKNVQASEVVPNISLSDLNIGTTSVDTYLSLFALIMAESSQVRRYELNVFSDVVTKDQTGGTPELQKDAILYQKIGAAILLMEVPKELATQHLEVVRSVGALARAVANMGTWSGDPIESLAYIDTFNKAESYVKASVSNLVTAADMLKKKS